MAAAAGWEWPPFSCYLLCSWFTKGRAGLALALVSCQELCLLRCCLLAHHLSDQVPLSPCFLALPAMAGHLSSAAATRQFSPCPLVLPTRGLRFCLLRDHFPPVGAHLTVCTSICAHSHARMRTRTRTYPCMSLSLPCSLCLGLMKSA